MKGSLNNKYVLGIDIGGSHITAGLVDIQCRSIIESSVIRRKVDRHAPAKEILDTWAGTIREVEALYPGTFQHIGFAMPGPFDYKNGICLIKGFDKYEALYNMNIREALAERLDLLPENLCFRNDAEAFLEGELFCGAARGFCHVIGITLGTGLGSATSHYGVTVDAALSVLEYQGQKIEEFVSTRGMVAIYQQLTGVVLTDALAICDRFYTDPMAAKAIELFCGHLSWFLRYFIDQEKPEVLVIGGNIAQAYILFIGTLRRQLANVSVFPVIVHAMLGENAALIGAASSLERKLVSSAT